MKYQLTHWMPEDKIESFTATFKQYREVESYVVKHSDVGWAVFTKGDLMDKLYK